MSVKCVVSTIFSNLHFKGRFSNKICVLSVPRFAKIKFEMLFRCILMLAAEVTSSVVETIPE